MKVQPVIVISPLVYLLVTFWKPLLVAFVVFVGLLYLMLPVAAVMGMQAAARHDAAQPTLSIPVVWRDALTQGALRDAIARPTP